MSKNVLKKLEVMWYLPKQHSQQKEDEDADQQTDSDDPSHHITPGLLTVKSLKQQLEHNTYYIIL